MKALPYTHACYSIEIALSKSPADVFDHVLQLSKWWPEEFIGESLQPDADFILRTGEEHYSKNKVIELVAGKKLAWQTTESYRKADTYDWTGTKFIFELEPLQHMTSLRFTYDGVVLENEKERLAQICDFCISERLYNFIESFSAVIEIPRSPQQVFDIITADVSKWWGGRDLAGNTTTAGDEFIVHHPGAHFSKQKLVDVIPGTKVAWLVTGSTLHWVKETSEWTNTKMVFEISTKGNNAVLHFMHEGLTPRKECYEKCAEGWTTVITDWLYHYITDGKVNARLS
jgi:uncharacterized protein YndB with AHSA1/START domain